MKKSQARHLQDFKHPLVTRRDFLTHGLIAFGAVATLPSLGSYLAPNARKALDGTNTSIPFLTFDMAGGGSMHGNFLAGKAGGPQDLLASYDTLGWNPRESGSLNTDFGLPMSAKYSKILAGILQTASASARANFRMGSFCHNVAQFDSQTNNLNSSILVLRSGVKGSYITTGGGVVDSLSGGNSAAIQQATSFKPVVVNSIDDILKSVSFGGAASDGLSISQLRALVQGSMDLGAAQLQPLANSPGGYALSVAATPAYGQSMQFLTSVQGLDPRQDSIAQSVYKLSKDSPSSDPSTVVAGLVMNTVLGNSGPSTWTLGDCDYHTGNRADGDRQDLLMGQQIGLAVEYAYRQKKPLFFQLITDGSCTAESGTRNWSADSFACMTIIGYFHPTAAPTYMMNANQPRLQIGNFTDAQSPDTTTLVGNSSDFVANAVFANYLNVSGRLGEFNNFAPGIFTKDQLESVLIFDGGTSKA